MTLPEVKEVLDAKGVTPSRKLGQNFLHDANAARWIVDQLEVEPGDCVVEVGPGTGALSEHLQGRVRKLILVEFDRRLAEHLREKFADDDSVEIYSEDGAKFDVRRLWKEQPVKMLGNLPYSSGGAIMRNFLKAPTPIQRAVIMLQKEVIDRIVAVPRTKSYGVLTLRMQSEWDSRPVKTIGPECFHPRPIIDSTVMVCEPRAEKLPVFDRRLFDELIRRGFAQRRKMLRKAVPSFPAWEDVFAKVNCTETARAEELSLEQWVELTRCYDENSETPAQLGEEVFDVVDEDDVVIRQESREVVHRENLRHRAVHVLVINGKREILLQQRSSQKDVDPGKWSSSAAGHLDAGENYEAAAHRELNEELGIESEEFKLSMLGRLTPEEKNGWEFVNVYLTAYSGMLRTPANEVEATLWMGTEELESWITARPADFTGSFHQIWGLLKEKGL